MFKNKNLTNATMFADEIDTPEQRANDLLHIHGGACFIPEGSDLLGAFSQMEKEGTVTIREDKSGVVSGFTIRKKGFRLHKMPRALGEEPAH